MTDNNVVENKAEDLAATGSTVATGKADRKKVVDRATWFVYSAILIVLIGLLDPMHASLLCLGNAGITALRMVFFLTAISLVLTAVGMVIPDKRWRIYYGLAAFFVGFWIVMQPIYYTKMRVDATNASCIWRTDTGIVKRAL